MPFRGKCCFSFSKKKFYMKWSILSFPALPWRLLRRVTSKELLFPRASESARKLTSLRQMRGCPILIVIWSDNLMGVFMLGNRLFYVFWSWTSFWNNYSPFLSRDRLIIISFSLKILKSMRWMHRNFLECWLSSSSVVYNSQ